jgi:hypothetical protein
MSMPALAQVPAKRRSAILVAVVALGLSACVGVALAQTTQPQSAEPPPAATPDPPPSPPAPLVGGGGLLEKLGDLLRDSAEGVSSGLKGTQQRIDDINKGTLDTLSRIPVAGFATGRALCPRASNGAPDCYAATDKLCKEKGYSGGRNLQSAHLSSGLSAQGRRLPGGDLRHPRRVPVGRDGQVGPANK